MDGEIYQQANMKIDITNRIAMIEKKGFYSDKPAGENTRIIDRSFITQHLTISFVKVTRVATIKWVALLSKLGTKIRYYRSKKVKSWFDYANHRFNECS